MLQKGINYEKGGNKSYIKKERKRRERNYEKWWTKEIKRGGLRMRRKTKRQIE